MNFNIFDIDKYWNNDISQANRIRIASKAFDTEQINNFVLVCASEEWDDMPERIRNLLVLHIKEFVCLPK